MTSHAWAGSIVPMFWWPWLCLRRVSGGTVMRSDGLEDLLHGGRVKEALREHVPAVTAPHPRHRGRQAGRVERMLRAWGAIGAAGDTTDFAPLSGIKRSRFT